MSSNQRLYFGDDPDHDADTGIFKGISRLLRRDRTIVLDHLFRGLRLLLVIADSIAIILVNNNNAVLLYEYRSEIEVSEFGTHDELEAPYCVAVILDPKDQSQRARKTLHKRELRFQCLSINGKTVVNKNGANKAQREQLVITWLRDGCGGHHCSGQTSLHQQQLVLNRLQLPLLLGHAVMMTLHLLPSDVSVSSHHR